MQLKHALPGQTIQNLLGGRLLVPRGAIEPRKTVVAANIGSLSSHASNNVEGTYVDLFAPIADDAYGLIIHLGNNAATRDSQVDIAFGGSGAEVVVVADLLLSHIPAGNAQWSQLIPLFIKRGTTVRIRHQCSTGGTTVDFHAYALGQNMFNRIYRKCETWGAVAGDSGGTSIDPGGSANTKPSSYTQLIASTAKRVRALNLCIGNQSNSARTQYTWLMDIAVGAASSESIIVPDLRLMAHASNDFMFPQTIGPIPVDIPAGTRVSARASCSGTDATDRLFDLVAYGFSEDV